jgi:hypothetical protein
MSKTEKTKKKKKKKEEENPLRYIMQLLIEKT